ncbi:MAG: murein L,D-transpeptidase catalytic domain family protein [Elusimicrobia bacterium]|nr:murein L,D-transpeptidase catalytic domain family protein [Elusimicrobiota bacterium]
MKKVLIFSLSLILSSGALMAKSMEEMRKSSEDISIHTGSLTRSAATTQYQVSPPVPVLIKAIVHFFKLLFGANGDIEIANPCREVPQVEGTLADDKVEEQYTEGSTYTPLDPADLQEPAAVQQPQQYQQPHKPQQSPQAQQPQQPRQDQPGQAAADGADRSGKVPEDLKAKALVYFNAHSDQIKNKRYIGIVDFSAHSSKERFFILDMQSGGVHALHVAHGLGSDPDADGYATRFSNVPDSKASSLGFYLTGALYVGSHGKSMRLHGLSSTNSNALSRAVVVHESAYVKEARMRQGRSFGCLAVSTTEIRKVLNSLNGGALIYAGLSNSEF